MPKDKEKPLLETQLPETDSDKEEVEREWITKLWEEDL